MKRETACQSIIHRHRIAGNKLMRLGRVPDGDIVSRRVRRVPKARATKLFADRAAQRRSFPRAGRKLLPLAALIGLLLQGHPLAHDREHRLHGVFCNTERQLDETLDYMRRNLPPRSAVELVNQRAVVCNYVDSVQYVVDGPMVIGMVPGAVPLIKYKARLTGVLVDGVVREVAPPVQVFFVVPELFTRVSAERRI